MRSSTSGNYLTTGIAYAWHPHRDTWYSSPDCQINWWIPIYEIESDNAMAFHPRYWSRPVRNTSNEYNYYQWNQLHRGDHVAQYLTEDPRPLPRPSEAFEREPEVRLVCPVGGIILFAAAQMHSSVPNTSGRTRFSIDFRTVHLDDVVAKGGAPNLDNASTGTVMRDYLRATDFSRLPEEIVALYDDGSGSSGELVYSRSRTRRTRMTIFLTWLHIIAAVSWIGGMGFLSIVLVPVLKREGLLGWQTALFRAIASDSEALCGSPCFC